MTELLLQRGAATPVSTPGELSLNGDFFCWTLERPSSGLFPRISAGRFALQLYPSPPNAHGFPVPLLVDVPGRSFIEIHPANWAWQLRGCIAPGVEREVDAVWDSRAAFDRLMAKIVEDLSAGQCWITVKDA